jgi:DNA-binding NtrC family response regulator
MRSNWPGNVRELKHYIERLFANTTGDAMYPDSLPNDLAGPREAPAPTGTGRLNEEIESVERRLILEALETADGNQSQAARLLGIPEPSLRYRLKKYASELSRENLRARQKFRIDPKRLNK